MISSFYDICVQRAKMHDGKHVFDKPHHGCVWWLYKVHLLFSCEMLLAIEYHPRKEDVLLAVNGCSDTLRCTAFFRLQPAINLEKLRWSCRRSELQGMSGTGRSLCHLSKSVLGTSTLHGDWNAHWYALVSPCISCIGSTCVTKAELLFMRPRPEKPQAPVDPAQRWGGPTHRSSRAEQSCR